MDPTSNSGAADTRPPASRPRVVIVGGGFGGVAAVRALAAREMCAPGINVNSRFGPPSIDPRAERL